LVDSGIDTPDGTDAECLDMLTPADVGANDAMAGWCAALPGQCYGPADGIAAKSVPDQPNMRRDRPSGHAHAAGCPSADMTKTVSPGVWDTVFVLLDNRLEEAGLRESTDAAHGGAVADFSHRSWLFHLWVLGTAHSYV
jgi:hypothetical protein